VLREYVADKKLKLEYLPTEDMVADILTKPLAQQRFDKLKRKLLGG
jgi:hypothetical protein